MEKKLNRAKGRAATGMEVRPEAGNRSGADTAQRQTVHGSAIVLDGRGVLIRGGSGAGKSELVLELLSGSFRNPRDGTRWKPEFVGDDRIDLVRAGEAIQCQPHPALRGLLEVRQIGLLRLPYTETAPLALVVDLSMQPGELPRLPPRASTINLLGVEVPRLVFKAHSASNATKLLIALALSDWISTGDDPLAS